MTKGKWKSKQVAQSIAMNYHSQFPWYSYNVVMFTDGQYGIIILDQENIIDWLGPEAGKEV